MNARPLAPVRTLAALALALWCVLVLGAGSAAAAAPRLGTVEAERALGAAERLLGGAGARNGGRAPAAAAARGVGARRATLVLAELARALPFLGERDRSAARSLLARPDDGRNSDSATGRYPERGITLGEPLCGGGFCVHWVERDDARSGKASYAVDPADSDADGFPDYVEEVLEASQLSLAREVGQLGWQPPKSDGERGGAGAPGSVDVYVSNIDVGGAVLYGYATIDDASAECRRQVLACASYLVIDNDYQAFNEYEEPIEPMQVTVAHEFNHVLQFSVGFRFLDLWASESGATWMEEQVYPEVNDWLGYLRAFAAAPDRPLTAAGASGGSKVYGDAIFNHWLSADPRYGPALIREVWERMNRGAEPSGFGASAYDKAIRAAGGPSLWREFADFAAETAEWKDSSRFPDTQSARFPDQVMRGASLRGGKPLKGRLDHLAYEILPIPGAAAMDSLRLRASVERGTRSAAYLVGIDRDGADPVVVTGERSGRGGGLSARLADPGGFDRVSAVIVNADERIRGYDRGRGDWNYTSDDRRYELRLGP